MIENSVMMQMFVSSMLTFNLVFALQSSTLGQFQLALMYPLLLFQLLVAGYESVFIVAKKTKLKKKCSDSVFCQYQLNKKNIQKLLK